MEKALAALEQLKPLIEEVYLDPEVIFSPSTITTKNVQAGYYEAKREGEVIDWHSHKKENGVTEYLVIVQGQIRMELKGREPKIYKRKEVCIIPPGVEHRADIIEYPLIMIFITIPPEQLYAGKG